jgi:hypothetical protein
VIPFTRLIEIALEMKKAGLSEGFIEQCFNASESAGTIQSGSKIPFSHTTLTCPQAPASIPIGVAIKSTDTYITQLGLICGAWTVQ